MPESSILDVLYDLIGAIQHFGERITVQRQITAMLAALFVAWLIANVFWFIVGRRLENRAKRLDQERDRQLARYALTIGKSILFPLLAIFGLGWLEQNFNSQSYPVGLISGLKAFMWVIFVYRLLVGILYARLDKQVAQRYHHRFLAPLMSVLTLAWVINHLIPITRLALVPVWKGITNPVTLGAILVATVGFYFWFDGSGVLQDVTRAAVRPFTEVHNGSLEAILIIGRYVLIAIGIYIVFTVLGFDSTTLAFLTAGLSVGIGFGLKEVIGNLISGILLLVDQSLRPGDIISIEGQIGTVRHVGIRATIVNTLNNVDVVVPNQTFLTAAVTTFSKMADPVRMLIPVETSDAHSPHEVRDALLAVAHAHPLVVDDPSPKVFYVSTGDTSRNYELAIWYKDPLKTVPLHSELYYNIFDEFDRRGINPATPARDLNITNIAAGKTDLTS